MRKLSEQVRNSSSFLANVIIRILDAKLFTKLLDTKILDTKFFLGSSS